MSECIHGVGLCTGSCSGTVVSVQRKYTRVTMKKRKPEWVMCPKCHHIIVLREKKK